MKYYELVIEDPRIYRDTSHTRKWVVIWRVFNQKIELEQNLKRRFFFKCMADSYAGQLMHSAPHAPQVNRTPPKGYGDDSITRDEGTIEYYMSPQPNYYGATPLFLVMEKKPGSLKILAERCYPNHGVEIVNALRFRLPHLSPVQASKNKEFPLSG